MVGNVECVIKRHRDNKYKQFIMTFNDERHFTNWYRKTSTYATVIGVAQVRMILTRLTEER